MTTSRPDPIAAEQPEATPPTQERRRGRDRRARGAAGRRGRRWRPSPAARRVLRDVTLVVGSVATIVFTARHTRRIYTNDVPVAQRIFTHPVPQPQDYDTLATLADTVRADSIEAEAFVRTPDFQADQRKFAEDLVRTGRVTPARADSLAFYIVREAYLRNVPPAVIFGVMMTENALFVSDAKSNVGAVGLMQVYPKIWLKELGDRFGTDLRSDSTNVRYGVFILSKYFNPKRGESDSAAWSRGLLRYNGCVRGTNTPHCKTYPKKVQRYVETGAKSLCEGKSFRDCIIRPMISGLVGEGD